MALSIAHTRVAQPPQVGALIVPEVAPGLPLPSPLAAPEPAALLTEEEATLIGVAPTPQVETRQGPLVRRDAPQRLRPTALPKDTPQVAISTRGATPAPGLDAPWTIGVYR